LFFIGCIFEISNDGIVLFCKRMRIFVLLNEIILKVTQISILLFLFFLISCSNNSQEKTKELLIYCGITMEKPISEIAEIIEKQENCKIFITIGGSENLYNSFLINEVGDLYISGSESYIEKGIANNYIEDTVFVGVNRAVMMVKKGNPKKIDSRLESLLNKNYKVVIGNPNSGSIGKETKKILDKKHIFKEVSKNVIYFTTDSKDLLLALKKNDADLIINWHASSTWDDNRNYIDEIIIDEEYASEKKLYLGLLKYSLYPNISKKFIEYASSAKGKAIFKKYGF